VFEFAYFPAAAELEETLDYFSFAVVREMSAFFLGLEPDNWTFGYHMTNLSDWRNGTYHCVVCEQAVPHYLSHGFSFPVCGEYNCQFEASDLT
jgi:hypothetical protein